MIEIWWEKERVAPLPEEGENWCRYYHRSQRNKICWDGMDWNWMCALVCSWWDLVSHFLMLFLWICFGSSKARVQMTNEWQCTMSKWNETTKRRETRACEGMLDKHNCFSALLWSNPVLDEFYFSNCLNFLLHRHQTKVTKDIDTC